jgi:hypothetical protein
LQNVDSVSGQRLDHGVYIIDLEENVMNSFTLLLEKVPEGVAIPLQELDKLQFKWPDLQKGLPVLDVLLCPAIVVP